ncbi:hypothetical protein FRC03_005282 [Tulasnella sp. 419]|nr:hypothetical protein FRC03_005282 [Tulasnella sp. 419]
MAQIASAQMQYELPQVSSPQSPGYWQNLPDAPTLNSTCSRRIDSDTSFWQTYITEAERYDKEIVDGWSRALDNLLVFSGLFSAVNTAFIIETYQLLQPDHAEDTANMFRLFLKHRHDDHQFTDEDLDFFKSSPRSAIRTNSLFFASLSCSLLVAIGAVQAKDWLTQYDHNGLAAKPLSVQARTRQKKFDGLERWRFRLFLAVLPLLLKIALGLFMFGVIFFLWEINNEVAGVVVAISLVGLLATVASWLIAVRYSTSPFQTPLSAHLHSPVTRSLARVSQIAHRVKAFSIVIVELQLFWLRWALRSWPSRQPGARWLNRFQLDVSKTLARMRNLEQDPSTGEISIERKLEDRTSAECIGWLFEQAEHEDVTLRTLNVASLLPPDHVLAAFDKRAGLLDRLATRYNTHVTQLVGRKRSIAEPEKALIAGIALFHLLKPQVLFTSRTSKLTRGTISTHRIRSIPIGKISGSSGDRDREGCLVMSQNADVEKVLAVVMCCVETLLPDSEGADETSFSDCFNYASESSNTPVTIPVPQSAGLSITLFPLNLLLDALIASAVRDIVKKAWRADWYTFYDIRKVLSHLKVVLDGDPTEETISHIAILIAVVQMIKHPEKRGEPGVLDKKLKDVLSAWYVVDKRSTVFRSIILAFDMADQVGPDDQDIKQVYLALLRYLDDYLPKDMEVSKKSGWATWWPNAMNLYPRVLGFLSQIKEEIPLDDVLRVFARLLPDDWQYNDIQEALQSRHTKETYPQVHALCPITFDESNAPDQKITVIGLIFQALKNTSGENLNPSPTVRDSIVELLGWLVAYPGASGYLPSLVQKQGGGARDEKPHGEGGE